MLTVGLSDILAEACSENVAGELRRHASAAQVTALDSHALMIEAHI